MDTPGPWNPAPASISPSLQLPTPAIVFIAVGIYLLLLGLVLLTRHCLLAQGCCTDCSSPCRKQGASETQDCCWSCAEACDFPLPSPAHYLDACCPHPSEAGKAAELLAIVRRSQERSRELRKGWAPQCPRCCPLCDCACACQLPDCQSLNCLCFEIKLR
ncbi:uncharaterized LOC112694756 homolog isoform X2 [Mastomys coucha]|uniref:uncharaterized LOC112694756 homolog isoform X2 n=1 Tax=Mastomys coucha TaxID=35658 RepID=UPI00126182AE|nr:uncharaterized LOC112694756 homolog isoform X2 [Mastomys coucha]XP_031244170.1 uncharaterized LOC112694756 homolog isoform X2 [Mastomys coucha]XP_031244171.1 uncharaterized LOC112694756 homolog isoform X2 [Mastomys coucha]XP_031244172.1 uncharaterized LOC112694756 homolog isoform X2 [Mastomys coucha]